MNLEETKAKAEKLRKDAERISEEAKLCADLDEATEMHEEAFAALYEAAELQKRIEAYEKARQEFAWSIRTSRLCAAAVRTHLKPETSKEEAERTTKAEALEYVEAARKHCAKWLKTERQWETSTRPSRSGERSRGGHGRRTDEAGKRIAGMKRRKTKWKNAKRRPTNT